MHEQFEISGYKITTDPAFQDNRDHITPSLKLELEKLYPQIQKGNKTVIRKLLHLIERHPKNPQLKNYLSSAYQTAGDSKKAVEVNEWILKEHPNYLFGLLNKAYNYINNGTPEKVTEILGVGLDLKTLYPERKEFHLAEVTGFFKMAVIYFTAIDNLDEAETRMDILEEIAPNHPDTKSTRNHLFYKRLEAGARRFEKDEKTKIKVQVPGNYQSVQTTEKPFFNHPEIEWLYQNDNRIKRGKLEKILSLPKETLIADLKTILKDIVQRYRYFRELDEAGKLKEEECFFGCHAVYLLGELEANEALDAIWETFKQDSDFLQFWYFDLLSGSFWNPLLRMGKNQLEKFKTFVLTPNVDTYARAEVVYAVTQLSFHYPERRQEVIEWFREIMSIFIASNPDSGIIDSDQIGLMIGNLYEMRGVELLGEIEQLYDLSYVSTGISGTFESIKEDIARKPEYDFKHETTSIFEEYDELNNTAISNNSQQTDLPPKEKSIQPKPAPVIPTNKVGRNDPCPCGSGKKYKKCCMNK